MYPAHELHGVVGTDLRQAFDMRDVIARVVDGSRFREFKKEYGTSIVTVSLCSFAIATNNVLIQHTRASHMCTVTQSASSPTTT